MKLSTVLIGCIQVSRSLLAGQRVQLRRGRYRSFCQQYGGKTLCLFLILLFHSGILWSQRSVIYKSMDSVDLKLIIYEPAHVKDLKLHAAIIFFFGGGWRKGSPSQFRSQAVYFAGKGLTCFLVDYRVENRNHTTPFEALKDAKSAIRFVKQHADQFHIDSSKIVASGGSAGGHLAAATALTLDYNEPSDNLAVSARPAALVLFNPVIDNGPGGAGYDRIGETYPRFSPLHNIRQGAPPTLIMLGTEDKHIPVATARYYKTVMEKVGSRCDLILYDHARHGFFNQNKLNNNPYYQLTLKEAEKFLISLGYIKN